jgi:hypothetical protein
MIEYSIEHIIDLIAFVQSNVIRSKDRSNFTRFNVLLCFGRDGESQVLIKLSLFVYNVRYNNNKKK